jgi:DNA-binding NarL/FixJ family response regulator
MTAGVALPPLPLSPEQLRTIRDYVARSGPSRQTDALRVLLTEIDRLSFGNVTCPLTLRQRHVVVGLARGETAAATGRRLNLSANTVRSHRLRTFRRLRVTSGAQAVAVAFANGWITRHDLYPEGDH